MPVVLELALQGEIERGRASARIHGASSSEMGASQSPLLQINVERGTAGLTTASRPSMVGLLNEAFSLPDTRPTSWGAAGSRGQLYFTTETLVEFQR